MSENFADMYRETRLRFADLVNQQKPEVLASSVPACPQWTVLQLTAHLAGVATDLVEGRLEGNGTDPWTEAQVSVREGQSREQILAEWEENGSIVESWLRRDTMPRAWRLIIDLATHEQDLRGAIAQPGGRDTPAYHLAMETFWQGLTHRIKKDGLAPLRIRMDGDERVTGEEPPGATVVAPAFEVLRAMSGRRSLRQIRNLDWTGDPEPYVRVFSHFPPPHHDLVE